MNNLRDSLQRQMPYLWIITVAFIMATASEPLRRFYDDNARPWPWITAEVEILPDTGDGFHVRYDVQADIVLRGTWSAWLEVGDRQMCFGLGVGNYGPSTKRNRIWPLTEWLAAPCAMPVVPFRACVAYVVTTSSGSEAGFGPYCSELFDPRKVMP